MTSSSINLLDTAAILTSAVGTIVLKECSFAPFHADFSFEAADILQEQAVAGSSLEL